eukprot:TRINITY_DN3254_c0_g1_i1.p1 TRINITY_DN3254_c0_g1~~TRINITY_DN3254_c0_g1_i1.p1  ORF type:complete len:311 (-),score=83.68 TRINITY_DN3254_c0_g1_i1:233-1165(-)
MALSDDTDLAGAQKRARNLLEEDDVDGAVEPATKRRNTAVIAQGGGGGVELQKVLGKVKRRVRDKLRVLGVRSCGTDLFFHTGTVLLVSCLIASGMFGEWYRGEQVSIAGVSQSLVLLIGSILCGCLGFAAAAVSINNMWVRKMYDDYEEKKHKLSGPRREYYESKLFKKKCNDLFDKADGDKSGSLDMQELQPVIHQELQTYSIRKNFLLKQAFDENKTNRVEKDEFLHMMQYVRMLKFKAGDISEEAAFEILQLDPSSATKKSVSHQYRLLAKRYHPDHRHDVPDEVKNKDMQEINDAKAVLDKKFGP